MRNRLRLIVMLTAVIAIAAPASAQIAQPTLRPSRPARGLFGGGVGDVEQSLIFNGSIGGGYDKIEGGQISIVPGDPAAVTPPWSGGNAYASASLAYSLSRGSVHADANISGQGRFRDGLASNGFNGLGFGGNIGWDIAPRTLIQASQGFSRQPRNMQMFYGNWFDAESAPNGVYDLSGATSLDDYTASQTAVTFQQGFTDRISLNAGYSYHQYFASTSMTAGDSRTSTAAVGLAYQIARGIRVRIGYGRTSAYYGDSTEPVEYGGLIMDGGLVFDRAVSLTRRTSVSFATGLTGARDEAGFTHYYVTGRATLNYEIGRSWTAAMNYRRGVDFNQSFGQPIVMDMVSAGVFGELNRRVQVGGGVAGSWGSIGISDAAGRYDSYSATSHLRFALTRELGVSVQYAYRYYFVDERSLPIGMQPSTDRQSIRATLDIWFPLFTRARRADAAR